MYRKNVAGQHLSFGLINASTGGALTGATVSGYRCIDGGTQAAVTGTFSEKGNGQYDFAMSQADTNGNNIGFLFTATSAIPKDAVIVTTAGDPTDPVRGGYTALPAAAAEAAGGLYTRGTGAGQINQPANGVIDVSLKQILGTALTETAGLIAAGFKKFFNVATPTGTVNSLPDVAPGASGGLPTADSTGSVKVQDALKRNVAFAGFEFLMVDSSNNPVTGLTITAQRSINGAALASCTNAATEVSNGLYKIDLSAADLNGACVVLRFSSAGAKDTLIPLLTTP